MSTWKASIAVCGALAIAVVTSTSASAAGPNPGDRPFVVSGSVNGLYPGGTTVLIVLVENPNDVELDLTLVSGAVSSCTLFTVPAADNDGNDAA